MLALSPELCGKIVEFTTNRRQDLLSLCLTCKAFQREAEIRIYSQITVSETQRTLNFCRTILHNDRLAQHVRNFWFNQEQRRTPGPVNLGQDFWSVIQVALVAMCNVEVLAISDNSYSNSWIFDSPDIQFRLRELKLRFAWDAAIVRFLENQPTLKTLHFYDSIDEINELVDPRALPELQIFDGTLMIGTQFLPSRLSHVQLVVDTDPAAALAILPRFGMLRKTLRGFSLLDVADETSVRSLGIVAQMVPELRHIGLFPYPMTGRHEFHKHLMKMTHVHSIELDLSRWGPPPTAPPSQRALVSELQTFCPSIKTIVLWIGTTRIRWSYSSLNLWQSRMDSHQYPQFSNAWCLV